MSTKQVRRSAFPTALVCTPAVTHAGSASTWLQDLLCHTSNVESQGEGEPEVWLPDSVLHSVQEIQQLQEPRERSLNHSPDEHNRSMNT